MSIEMKDWDEYFRNLLGGVEWRVVKGTSRGREKDGDKKLDRKEIEKVMGRLKDGKATERVFRIKCGSMKERK